MVTDLPAPRRRDFAGGYQGETADDSGERSVVDRDVVTGNSCHYFLAVVTANESEVVSPLVADEVPATLFSGHTTPIRSTRQHRSGSRKTTGMVAP